MRTAILTLICFFSVLTAQAQLKERGFFIETSIGYGRYSQMYIPKTNRYAMIEPSIGYKWNPKWVTGAKMQFNAGDDYYTRLTGYAQYHYWHKGRFELFGEMQATHAFADDIDGGNGSFQEAGIILGGTCALNNRFGLILHYGYSDIAETIMAGTREPVGTGAISLWTGIGAVCC